MARPKVIRCFADCIAQDTGDPLDCDCAERMLMAESAALENQVDGLRDAWVDAEYERGERDRSRAL